MTSSVQILLETFPWEHDLNAKNESSAEASNEQRSFLAGCWCGSSKICINGAPRFITLCHCSYCRAEALKKRKSEVIDPTEENEDEVLVEVPINAPSSRPIIFLGYDRKACDISIKTTLLEGPNDGRHSCRQCGQLMFMSYHKDNLVYINSGLFAFSKRIKTSQLERLSHLHSKGGSVPYVAHVWCKSDVDFKSEYLLNFNCDIPFYCNDLCISPRGTLNGMRLSLGEIKRLRQLGVASGSRNCRSPTVGADGREWTNEELKGVFNAAKFDRLEELKEYLENGAPVDCTPYGSQSPTYIAAFYGKLRTLKYLTEANADLDKIEKDGFTPAHAASSEGHLHCLRWLQENGGSLSVATITGQTCLSLARRASRAECVRYLEAIVPAKEWSKTELKKVFDAAKSGRIIELKGYVDDGAPVDCTPYGSQSPTYIACFYGREACLDFLASSGADLNKTEKDGFTPAHAAASEGHVKCLRNLYRYGADLSYSTSGGQTCLSLAERSNKQNVVRWLKANVDLAIFGRPQS